jgi:hypothetical protein
MALSPWAAMASFFHLFVIGYEEPALTRCFGVTYLEYQRTVPRWILPPAAPRPPTGIPASARPLTRKCSRNETVR